MTTTYPGAIDAFTNPTGTDQTTSPDHAAQHANANDAIEAIEATVGLTGTSFPVTPTSGDRFYRTDLKMPCVYDGSRWLSVQRFAEQGLPDAAGATSTSGAAVGRWSVWSNDYDVWIEEFRTTTFVNTTNNGSNYWTVSFDKFDGAGATSISTGYNTSAHSAGVAVSTKTTVGALLGTAHDWIRCKVVSTGTPGSIFVTSKIVYRLVIV